MRMHRGSSKGRRGPTRRPEHLPLSVPRPTIRVTVETVRAAATRRQSVCVPPGHRVNDVLRAIGAAGEGSLVLIGENPVPLDTIIDRPVRLTVIPTFSGG